MTLSGSIFTTMVPVQQPLGDLCVISSKNRAMLVTFISHAYNTRKHIYRQHAVQIFCTRCEPKFDHCYDIQNPIVVVCEPLPLQFDLDQVEERDFWSLWRWHISRTEEERWQFMYRLLFPTDGRTLSPCELLFKTRSPQ